jgi:drug/metabolite transporter (DMT)-like permease
MAARYGVRVWLALATVYVVWGSTFIALAIVIRDLPPFLAMSVRHLIAGGVLLAVSLPEEIALPTRSDGVRSQRRSSSAASSS